MKNLANYILVYREWEMLRRHIDKLLKEEINGRIYPTFNTIGTETGRFSCTDPNLQQVPAKTRAGRAIRKGIIGDFIIADYSNVELRLLAHFSKDSVLTRIYSEGGSGDLHREFAAELFQVSFEGVTKRQRGLAKTINFGISYGMGPRRLSEQLQIDYEKAENYIKKWYELYSRVQPWKDGIVKHIRDYGFVRSVYGRKRRINFNKIPYNEQWQAEREAINFVIQGSSADITKLAVKKLKDEDIRLQVHDELVIENPKRSIEEIKQVMESVGVDLGIKIPLIVDIKRSNVWEKE